ncbi:MAG: hypothetical protein HY075_00285 [Deltaproteobacteria bacterium]|nr:hypothetical protein [Deltaproteobacteria bacterium]
MSQQVSVPKWNRNRAVLLLAFLFGTVFAAYVTWTHVSARMVLRWFVRETGIPVEVRAASWDARLRELLDGKIRALHLDVYYKPLDVAIVFDTPVRYARTGGHWSIKLEPRLRVGDFPPTTGSISVELDAKRDAVPPGPTGGATPATGASVELHLREVEPLSLALRQGPAGGTVSAESWTVDGWVRWAKDWSSELVFRLGNAKAQSTDGSTSLSAKSVRVTTRTAWPARPPLPLAENATVEATELTALSSGLFIQEPIAIAIAKFRFDGRRFEQVDISVDKPVRLDARGSFGEGALDGRVTLRGTLDELFTARVAPWLEARAPLLRRAKAQGALDFTGRVHLAPGRPPSASGRVKLSASKVELPARGITVEALAVDLPLEYPGTPGWGKFSFETLDFHSVKLKHIALQTRLSREGIDVTTEGEDEKDHPIHQSVWGGAFDISNFYAHAGGDEGTEFTASVVGGPFRIPEVQTDLCIMPKHPVQGLLSFTYPGIVLDRDSFALTGDTNLALFNGSAHVGDMRLSFGDPSPRLRFDLDWNDLDMLAIGQWTGMGDMRGSLTGSFLKAELALTPVGPIPLSYDFTFRGLERGGNAIRFYGRAIDSVATMVSGGKDLLDSIPDGALPLRLALGLERSVGTFLRNLMPATARYLGFHAKTDSDWTELSTFDPPDAPCDPAHPEKHFLLCGTGFNIPLNTHGVYPVVMKTDSFHGWLAGIVQNVKSRFGHGAKNETRNRIDDADCTPPW